MLRIWLNQGQPERALHYIKGFNPSLMSPEEVQQVKQLAATAKKHLAT